MEHLRIHVRERGLESSTVSEAVARVALGIDGHFSIVELMEHLPPAGSTSER